MKVMQDKMESWRITDGELKSVEETLREIDVRYVCHVRAGQELILFEGFYGQPCSVEIKNKHLSVSGLKSSSETVEAICNDIRVHYSGEIEE